MKQNVVRRGICVNDTDCLHGCGRVEDEMHVFFPCPFARGLWFHSPWGIRWEDTPNQDINEYLKHIWNPDFLGSKFILYSVCIIDHIWWTRNAICHNDFKASMNVAKRSVKDIFEVFSQAFRAADLMEGRQNVVIDGWQPPPRNSIKINTDVAVRRKESTLGFVARNSNGEVMEVHAFKFCHGDPIIAELSAAKKAIQVSLTNGWKNIVCESDALTIVQCLNGGSSENFHWAMEPILKEISSWCNFFDSISFCSHGCQMGGGKWLPWCCASGPFSGFVFCLPNL